jgi:hypothetical protein
MLLDHSQGQASVPLTTTTILPEYGPLVKVSESPGLRKKPRPRKLFAPFVTFGVFRGSNCPLTHNSPPNAPPPA